MQWCAIGKTGADVNELNDLLPAVGAEVRARSHTVATTAPRRMRCACDLTHLLPILIRSPFALLHCFHQVRDAQKRGGKIDMVVVITGLNDFKASMPMSMSHVHVTCPCPMCMVHGARCARHVLPSACPWPRALTRTQLSHSCLAARLTCGYSARLHLAALHRVRLQIGAQRVCARAP